MIRNKITPKELFRFMIGGGSAVITDYIVYHLFMYLGLSVSYSKGISFICGSVVGFIINKSWTFESSKFSKGEILRYVILYSITACINAFINHLVLMQSGTEMLAFLAATGVSTILNFLGQKYFVFRKEIDNK